MADFKTALPFVLAHEGGWSDDPADPGGATMQGITLKTAQCHGIQTKEALRSITPDQVAAIYEADYWRYSGVYNQAVATKLFDMAVNFGPYQATKLVQQGLNDIGAALIEDGRWGPRTEDSVNAVNPTRMLDLLCQVSEMRYRDIVTDRPGSLKFLNGWLARAAAVPRG